MMAPPKTLAAAAVRPRRMLRRMGCMPPEDNTSSLFPVLGSRLGRRPDGANQAVQYLPKFRGFLQKLLAMFRSEVGQVLRDHELGFDLDQRSAGAPQEKIKFVRGEACLAFGDIGWNRNRCPAQLTGERVGFVPRKCLGGSVDVHHEVHGFLPGNEFPVRLSHKVILLWTIMADTVQCK